MLYYTSVNLIYFVLLVQSIRATVEHHRLLKDLQFETVKKSTLTPPISILVPARN